MENGDRVDIHERLVGLETKVKFIMENHLPHLQSKIDSVSKRLNWLLVLLFTTLIGICVNFFFMLFK